METVDLTPEQAEKWASTMSMMGWVAPGFQHLLYKLLNNHNGRYSAVITRDVPVAATDAKNVLINPDEFFGYTLPERAFIVGHEVLHNVFGDVELLHRCTTAGRVPMNDGSHLPFRNQTMQKAMDYRNNAILKSSNIGRLPADGLIDEHVTGTENILDIYRKVYEDEGEDQADNQGGAGGGFDQLLPPGNSTGQSPQQHQRNNQQWQVEIAAAQAIEQARSQGRMAAGLKRLFDQLMEPEVDWREHIKTLINRIGGSGGWNWKQPDEWWSAHDFFQPRKTGKGAGWIVIWGDTSGSRSDTELASTIAELQGMMEDVNPARLTMIWCDAEIADGAVQEITDMGDLSKLNPIGGGGTSVKPVYDWMNDQMDTPDLFIGFTDGYVSFPTPPRCPIIWAMSTDVKAPYGDHVRVLKRAKI